MKEAWASKWNFLFLCFAFTTLPLCWYPLFYAKSKSKFSHLACSDKKVSTDRLFWAKFASTLKIRTVPLDQAPVSYDRGFPSFSDSSTSVRWRKLAWCDRLTVGSDGSQMSDLTPLAAAFWGLTSSSKSLLLSGADWNTILTPGSRKPAVVFLLLSCSQTGLKKVGGV